MAKLKMGYNIGDKLIIDLGSECFSGELQFINKDRTRLTMKNVINFNTKVQYKSVQNYFASDIVSIICDNYEYIENCDELVNNTECNLNNNSFDVKTNYTDTTSNKTNQYEFKELISENSSDRSSLQQEDSSDDRSSLQQQQEINILRKNLKINEFEKIDQCLDNYKYITQTDINYHNALRDLNNQKCISIYIEPSKFGRNNGPTTIITIYSPGTNHVYLFDINYIGGIHKEFADIFINPKIIKIIYDGRTICDHLKYKHKINLNGIFDCFVSHLNISKNTKKTNLIQCLIKYINIPNTYFCNTEVKIAWHERPLDDITKILAAKTVILLYKLYEVHNQVLFEKMLEKFSKTCCVFAQTYCNNDDFVDVAAQMSRNDKTASNRVCNTDLNDHLDLQNITG